MKRPIFLLLLSLVLASCTPLVKSMLTEQAHTPIETDLEVHVVDFEDELPEGSTFVGDLQVGEAGLTVNCNYDSIMMHVEKEARRCGSNFVLITDFKEPNLWSTCYRVKAEMYRNLDPDLLASIAEVRAEMNKSLLPPDADYAVVYFYRPREYEGSAIGCKVHLEGEVIGRLRNGERFKHKTSTFGEHVFTTKSGATDGLALVIEPGEEYYIRADIITGALAGHPELSLVQNYIGREEYAYADKVYR